ncbi:hypothetical protein FJ967_13785 [Mesorhizobium sp. B2-3-4]|nr:hypothetical protein FJ967_13785 [Mesorhizobium sp. B2-3-4]
MHAAQRWTRFWDNDMHKSKRLKARRMDPFKHDALQKAAPRRWSRSAALSFCLSFGSIRKSAPRRRALAVRRR